MYGQLGRVQLIVHRYTTIVKFWQQISNIKQTHLTKVI